MSESLTPIVAHINIVIYNENIIFRFKVRELSIDVLVAYRTTDSTIASKIDVRAEILKEILNEFGIFRVFKPVLLVVKPVGEITGVDFEHLTRGNEDVDPSQIDSEHLVEDYTNFFKDLHDLSRIEDVIRDSLHNFFLLRNTRLSINFLVNNSRVGGKKMH